MASPQKTPLMNYQAAPTNGPFAMFAQLLEAATTEPLEGLWLPTAMAKVGSIELAGSLATVGITLLGTNAEEPQNTLTITVSGTVANNDAIVLAVDNPNLDGGSVTLDYTATGSDTIDTIAAALAVAINNNTALTDLGYGATVAGAVATLTWPSGAPSQLGEGGAKSQPFQNTTVLDVTTSGAEEFAIAGITDGATLGTISALGITDLSTYADQVRWIRARLTTLTGSGANVTLNFSGAG